MCAQTSQARSHPVSNTARRDAQHRGARSETVHTSAAVSQTLSSTSPTILPWSPPGAQGREAAGASEAPGMDRVTTRSGPLPEKGHTTQRHWLCTNTTSTVSRRLTHVWSVGKKRRWTRHGNPGNTRGAASLSKSGSCVRHTA